MIKTAADPAILVLCRCCLAPMEAVWWPSLGYHILTCRRAGCKLQHQTLTSDVYATMDLTVYGVLPMIDLAEGDVYLDQCGREVAVIRHDGNHAFIQEEGSDWMIETELLDGGVVVPIVRRASFCLLPWAVAYIDNRRWRAPIGEV